MLELEKQEDFYKCSPMGEPWKAINDICRDHLKGDYKILLYNIEDCNKYPDVLKFVAFDYQNLKVLIYREPNLKVYTYQDYSEVVKNIKGNECKFLSEGLKIQKEDEYKRLDLFKTIEEPVKIRQMVKGDKLIKQGGFLYTCWGYDQTNTELFVIKRIIGKNYLIVQEVAQKVQEGKGDITSDIVTIAPDIKKIDFPIKAYVSDEGRLSICENGYKRGLSLTDIKYYHTVTNTLFGH